MPFLRQVISGLCFFGLSVFMSVPASAQKPGVQAESPNPQIDPQIVAQIQAARTRADQAIAAGRYGEAEVALASVLAMARTIIPDDHPEMAIAINNVALMRMAQGKYADAKPMFLDVLARLDRHGMFTSETAFVVRDNLITTLRALGQLEEARTLAQSNLAGRRRHTPGNAYGMANALNSLMLTMVEQGAYREAQDIYQASPALAQSSDTQSEILRSGLLSNLALAYLGQDKLDAAETANRQALAIRRRILPPGHPDTALTLSNLASVLRNRGRFDEALVLQKEAYEGLRASLGPSHPNTIGALTNVGLLEERLGREERALSIAREVVDLRRRQSPVNPISLAKALNNLATSLVGTPQNDEAVALIEEARGLLQASLPPEHPDTLAYTLNLGVALAKSDRASQQTRALGLFQSAVAGWEKRPEVWHGQKASTRMSLVRSLMETGARAEAYHQQRQAGQELLAVLGTQSGLDPAAQSEFRQWQWLFKGQMAAGWFAAHPESPLAPDLFVMLRN
jgi:tetratricopeptide (TPR) repeat protein